MYLKDIIRGECIMQKIRPDMDIGNNIQTLRYKNNLTQD